MSRRLLSLFLALSFAVAGTAGVVVWGSGPASQPSAAGTVVWGN